MADDDDRDIQDPLAEKEPEKPVVPKPADSEKGRKNNSELDEAPPSEFIIKKRAIWPFFLVLLLIAGGIGGTVFYFMRKPEPLKVLIAIDVDGMAWDGGKNSAKLVDEVSDLLKKVGFEPVKMGDPEVDKILEKSKSPEDAARSLHAAFVITGSLKPKIIEEKFPGKGKTDSYFEARVDGNIEIRQIDDAKGKSELARVERWSAGNSAQQAADEITEGLGDTVFDEVAPRMMAHPTTQELLKGTDLKTITQLQSAKQYVDRRQKALDLAKKNYDEVDQKHQSGPTKTRVISYHGHFNEQIELAGTGPDGFLVETADSTPFVSPATADLNQLIRLERLEWRSPSGGDPKVVWEGYHIYSYPSTAPAGQPIIFVEDLFGRAKTITVVDHGETKRVRIDPSYRFMDPKIAPGGTAAAMQAKPCRDCPTEFMVVSVEDGSTLYQRNGDLAYLGYTWLDDHRVALVVKPPLDPGELDDPVGDSPDQPGKKKKNGPSVFVFDTKTKLAREIARLPGDDDSGYAFPSASPDGKTIAIEHATNTFGQDIGLFDVESGKLQDIRAGASCHNPVFSPDGKLVAYSERGDIKLVHRDDSKVEELTKNEFIERYPAFSTDGKLVYFESLDKDANFPHRQVSVVASVPVQP